MFLHPRLGVAVGRSFSDLEEAGGGPALETLVARLFQVCRRPGVDDRGVIADLILVAEHQARRRLPPSARQP
jgi:hypothetical protein